jgi:predicted RNA binding protein YcfA (HicA-like mRNA interferase family)
MSKWDKLLNRISNMSEDIRFDEVRKIMEYYGYKMSGPSGGSSHCTFRKPGYCPVTIPNHGYVKKIYIRMVKQITENEGENDENKESREGF